VEAGGARPGAVRAGEGWILRKRRSAERHRPCRGKGARSSEIYSRRAARASARQRVVESDSARHPFPGPLLCSDRSLVRPGSLSGKKTGTFSARVRIVTIPRWFLASLEARSSVQGFTALHAGEEAQA
jgi:hypothetical protein